MESINASDSTLIFSALSASAAVLITLFNRDTASDNIRTGKAAKLDKPLQRISRGKEIVDNKDSVTCAEVLL